MGHVVMVILHCCVFIDCWHTGRSTALSLGWSRNVVRQIVTVDWLATLLLLGYLLQVKSLRAPDQS